MSYRRGVLLFLLFAALFLAANHQAYQGYFQDDEIDNLSWTPFLTSLDYLQGLATPLWDTSWLLQEDSIVGRLLHTLVGYSASPDGAQLLAYALVILLMFTLMRLARGRVVPAARPLRVSH